MNIESRITEFWEFVNDKKRLPKKSKKDEYPIYELCAKVSANRNNIQDKMPDVWKQMREMGWMTSQERRAEREKEFCDYIDKHGVCLPEYGAKNYDRVKQFFYRLANNVGNAREDYPKVWERIKGKEIEFSSPRKKMIDEFWRFVNKNNRLPGKYDKEWESLYNWCRKFVKNRNQLREKYPEAWEKMKELSIPNSAGEITLANRTKEFWEFVDENNRLPKYSIKEEKSLYWWCGKVFSQYADRLPDVVAKLKELRWGNPTLSEKMSKLVSFTEENGRLPLHCNTNERVLYNLYRMLKNNKDGLRDKYADTWAKIFSYEQLSRGEKQQEALANFVKEHGRLPRTSDKGCRNLYQWCLRVVRNSSLQELYPEAYATLLKYKQN